MVAVLWPWCREVISLWGSLAGWSSSPPHSHFVNVFISRKDADRHKEKKTQKGAGRERMGVGGEHWGGGEAGEGSKQSHYFSWFSQSVCTNS